MTNPNAATAPTETAEPWLATRAEALARLKAFQPSMGRRYGSTRNHDFGPDDRSNVSMLSPFVRRRIVSEEELVRAALAAHSASACEKFVQEVFWRSYWKGWLEMRPSVWTRYCAGLSADRARLAEDGDLAARVREAVEGRTGLECFDAWARELVETGYLHNHARMWFASIWIFTLDLPWRLGADFFLRHLLDGDPASNTLGWRWVAGLHTRGKVYAAQAWNIARFTDQRFTPAPADLNDSPVALIEDASHPAPAPPAPVAAPEPGRPTALLLTKEDLTPGWAPIDVAALRGVAALDLSDAGGSAQSADLVRAFDAAALDDAVARVGVGPTDAARFTDAAPEALIDWAARCGASQIATSYAPVGPVRDWLDAARPALDAAGIALATPRRSWDEAVWPHATAGFFKVKDKIPKLLRALM